MQSPQVSELEDLANRIIVLYRCGEKDEAYRLFYDEYSKSWNMCDELSWLTYVTLDRDWTAFVESSDACRLQYLRKR